MRVKIPFATLSLFKGIQHVTHGTSKTWYYLRYMADTVFRDSFLLGQTSRSSQKPVADIP